MPIEYVCQRCTNCCKWPGVVKVEPDEIAAIAAFVGMKEEEFIEQHTRLRPDRRGLSLLEREDHSCAWLDGRDCALQAVKPRQCRAFPNGWNFPGWREMCEAVPVLVSDKAK
jgi:Fe-S-cluster containining protein